MPSGPPELHEKWGDLHTAWSYLKARGFRDKAGMLAPPAEDHVLTDEEASAVDYLCYEWDFSYDPAEA